MTLRPVAALSALLVILLAAPTRARAEGGGEARVEAGERFDRGLRLFEEGDYAGALAEFKRAHELVPNQLVLFNIGLTYAALGRPVEATDALDRVFADPARLPADRLERARRTRDEQAARIAQLTVTTNTPAAIDVDGVEAGRTPLEAPLRVASGVHVIGALAAGHLPSRRQLTIAAGETQTLAFELTPTESRLAHLTIESATPGAEVLVDGAPVGRTPLPASVAVAPGQRVVSLRRDGYREERRELTLAEGATGKLVLNLEEDAAAPPSGKGRLTLQLTENEAHVTVNGLARSVYFAPLTLPAGPHLLRLQRAGFEPIERTVMVPAGGETTVRISLVPTPETRLALLDRVQARKRWGSLAAGGGLAIALGAGALAIWSHQSLPGLERNLDAAVGNYALNSGGDCDRATDLTSMEEAICLVRIEEANERVSNRRLTRTLGAVGAGVGLAAAAVGLYLLLTNDDPHKYDRAAAPGSAPPPALTFRPSTWFHPAGAGAALNIDF